MKVPLPTLFLVSVTVGCAAPKKFTLPAVAAPVTDEVMLNAIAQVETGDNAARVGRFGERTQVQILPATWREYSHLPFSASARHPAETERVARKYLSHIRARLRARGLPETPFYIAASWNAGPCWRRLRPGTVDYARRVANIVAAQRAAQLARLRRRQAARAAVVAAEPHFSIQLAPVTPPPFIALASDN